MRNKKKNPNKFNVVLLIVTLITATLSAVGMYFLYHGLRYESAISPLYTPVVMGILFAAFLLVTVLVVFAVSNLGMTFRADVITGRYGKGRILLYMLIGVLVIAVVMAGAEFLYEMDFQTRTREEGVSTYVFLIDDSGTMDSNDPNDLRYRSIEAILSTKPARTQFTVYSFATNVKLVTPLQTVGDGVKVAQNPEYTLTNMKAGLAKVMEDYKQGIWSSKGKTSLILITDGDPTDFGDISGVTSILDEMVDEEITLGIVGVIGADNDLMQEMADYTGGTFTDITDIEELDDAVRSVSGDDGLTRDLLSEREELEMDWVYALIRVAALFVAGIIITVVAALCYGNSTSFNFILVTNIIKALVAAALMELAFLAPDLTVVLWLASWILMGTVFARVGETEEREVGQANYLDFYDAPGNGRR